TRRVDERERTVEADLFDRSDGLVEIVICLTRKPDDQIGAERKIWNAGAELANEPEVTLPGVGPSHRLQDARRAGLQGQMGVLAHRPTIGHRLDHRAAEVLGMWAREADALDPVDRVARPQQLAELRADLPRQVPPPRVDFLPEERPPAPPFPREPRHLGDDVSRTP